MVLSLRHCATITLLLLVAAVGCRHKQDPPPPITILERLHDPNPDVQAEGLFECIGRGYLPPEAIDSVMVHLRGNSLPRRQMAARALLVAGPEAKKYLSEMMSIREREADEETRNILDEVIFRLKVLP